MPKSRPISWSLKLLGSTLVTVGSVKTLIVTQDLSTSFLEVAFWIAIIVFGGFLILRGQQYGLPYAKEVLANDKRPPILFLRSFSNEVAEHRMGNFLKSAFAEAIPGTSISWGPREQAELGKQLRKIGPYIAIGRPGELIPELGAARIYVTNQEWQDEVTALMHKSILIIVQAGQTPGLTWEFTQLIRTAQAIKVLLILPRFQKEYDGFRRLSTQYFPHPLPDKLPKSRLITFHPNWIPCPLEPRPTLFWTIKPLLDQNGIPMPK